MSPAHFDDPHRHAPPFPPPLKTNRDSRSIRKPSPSSSSSSTTAAAAAKTSQHQQQQQRHPVIIYTHSPKIIHTQPHDFMALVQKLTGLSRSSPGDETKPPRPPPAGGAAAANSGEGDDPEAKSSKAAAAAGSGEDNECSSVITEENCSSSAGDGGQVNSCFAAVAAGAPGLEAANGGSSYLSNLPFAPSSAADFLCSNQPSFYDFSEATAALGFPGNNVRTNYNLSYAISSFERTNNFREF